MFWRRKINTSPTTVEDVNVLKELLTKPPVKKIDLHFTTGMDLTARNLKGVTIKDALDAIFKANKKRVRGRYRARVAASELGVDELTKPARPG
jgi:hypothetical protein